MRLAVDTYGEAQAKAAGRSKEMHEKIPKAKGFGLYYAEEYHQQYLAKNPGGYCGLGGTGVSCPAGVAVSS